MMGFMEDIRELRKEYAELELSLKNEEYAHRLQSQRAKTKAVLVRIPMGLLEEIDRRALEEDRNRNNYILKTLKAAMS